MIPKFRLWNRISSQLHLVDGLYFDDKEAEYVDDDNVLRFIGFKNIVLMQSTGLKDKNDKEIFEGDIVRTTRFLGRADEIGGFYEYEKDYLGVVKVLEGSWVIDTGSDAVNLWSEIDENEVLGNIYENRELLEDKE